MTSYADALAAPEKDLIVMVHFTGPDVRYINRDWPGRTSPATVGLRMEGNYSVTVDPQASSVRIGKLSPTIIDADQGVTAFLQANDTALADRLVDVYFGFDDVAEGDMVKATYFFRDYREGRPSSGKGTPPSFTCELVDVFSMTARSVYTFLDNNAGEQGLANNVNNATTAIRLEEDVSETWPASGEIMLVDTDKEQVELVKYDSITPGTPCTINVNIVGRRWTGKVSVSAKSGFATKVWSVDNTRVRLIQTLRGHPLDIMRRLLTTTAGGGNGTYDQADGNGIGDIIVDSLIDHTGIDDARDGVAPEADGWDFLFVLTKPITNIQKFIEKQLLQAAGFMPSLNATGQLTVIPTFRSLPTPLDIANKYEADDPTGWRRNWPERENNISLLADHNPAADEYVSSDTLTDAGSITAFKESKLRKIEAQGLRGSAGPSFGMPDLLGDNARAVVGQVYLLEFAYPAPTFNVTAFWSEKDRILGDTVSLTHPGVRHLGQTTRGTTAGSFLILKRTLVVDDKRGGMVKLELRDRQLSLTRPFFVNVNTAPAYASADSNDKLLGYISPNAGNFPDGGGPYVWLTGPTGDGLLVSKQTFDGWRLQQHDAGSPGLYNSLQGIIRENDRRSASKTYLWGETRTWTPSLDNTFEENPGAAQYRMDFYVPIDCDKIIISARVQTGASQPDYDARYEIGAGSGNYTDITSPVATQTTDFSGEVSRDISGDGIAGTRITIVGELRKTAGTGSGTLVTRAIHFLHAAAT